MSALLDGACGTRWDSALILALASGMRRGELAALRWADVQMRPDGDGATRGALTVRASFAQTRDTVTLKTTKSGKERRIPISRLAVAALEGQRFRQGHDAATAQEGYKESGFVFTDPLGAPYPPRSFTLAFDVIRRKAGVHKRLHDARHTAASHLLAAGVDLRTAATILGHANPSITLSIYSHQMAGLTEDAIDRLDGRLRAAMQRTREAGG